MKHIRLIILYIIFTILSTNLLYADDYIDPYQELGLESRKLIKQVQPVLVVCISYPNHSFMLSKKTVYNKFFRPQIKNSATGLTSSLTAYYNTMSQGGIQFTPASESFGDTNDGIVNIKVDIDCSGLDGRIVDDEYEMSVVNAVIDKLYDQGMDFSSYDENNDKVLQREELHIALCFAGSKAENGLWEHYLPKNFYDKNGIRLGIKNQKGFLILAEDTEIETICHEFGHSLGLPDLYNSNIGQTLNQYSLMDNNTDLTYLDAWCRLVLNSNKYNSNTYTTISKSGIYNLYSIKSGKNNILRINTENGYYLIENRDASGYDKISLNSEQLHGIIIYKINNDVLINTLEDWKTCEGDNIGIETLIAGTKKALKTSGINSRSSYTDPNTDIIFQTSDKPGDLMRIKITFPEGKLQ